MRKNENVFGWKEWLSFLPLLVVYVVLGSYLIFLANPLLGYGYIAFIVFFYVGITSYLFCTKCPHYGQRCSYIFAGVLAKRLFKKREGDCSRLEKTYPAIALTLLLGSPIPFALDKPVYLIAFLSIFILMFGIVKPFIVCYRCEYSSCVAKSISNKVKGEKR